MEPIWPSLFESVRAESGIDLTGSKPHPVHGGCISKGYMATSPKSGDSVFVKLNAASKRPMFEAEFLALEELTASKALRIPLPIAIGSDSNHSYIAMEWIALSSSSQSNHQSAMGRSLAALHQRTSQNGKFGWHRENVIGETPQHNPWSTSWAEFFARHRIGFQLELAKERHGMEFENGERICDVTIEFLADHNPRPSLLHGDLWGGNAGFDDFGKPVIYDPATYYGDSETDIAFSSLFGGFGPEFYAAYSAELPPKPGAIARKSLYNLYHVLNHFNLFGGGYAAQARQMIDSLVKGHSKPKM